MNKESIAIQSEEIKEEKAPELGKWVKRGTYQKVCEENKKLKADIYSLVMLDLRNKESLDRWNKTDSKWRDKFQKDEELSRMLHEYAVQYFKDHPETPKTTPS